MPEAMLPPIVVAVCSERGRSERACARGKHGAIYGAADGMSAWWVVMCVVRGRRIRDLRSWAFASLVGLVQTRRITRHAL